MKRTTFFSDSPNDDKPEWVNKTKEAKCGYFHANLDEFNEAAIRFLTEEELVFIIRFERSCCSYIYQRSFDENLKQLLKEKGFSVQFWNDVQVAYLDHLHTKSEGREGLDAICSLFNRSPQHP